MEMARQTLPRMRTAAGVLNEIKKLDPDTGITEHYVRRLIRENQVPVTHAGKKCLVNLDQVLELLTKGTVPGRERPAGIRRVEV